MSLTSITFLSSIVNLFKVETEVMEPLVDPSLYEIKTIRNNYIGTIAFQDDYMIKLKPADGTTRPVKILKENITNIQILKSIASS
jgi:hypothetical protein